MDAILGVKELKVLEVVKIEQNWGEKVLSPEKIEEEFRRNRGHETKMCRKKEPSKELEKNIWAPKKKPSKEPAIDEQGFQQVVKGKKAVSNEPLIEIKVNNMFDALDDEQGEDRDREVNIGRGRSLNL
uniref:Uncharacterized protein n=1 Tax=Cannabis sativa TaxID=3483 RepID=A0A803PE44_CANSA